MKKFAILMAVVLLAGVALARPPRRGAATQPDTQPDTEPAEPPKLYDVRDGPFAVQIVESLSVHDKVRNKDVEYKILYPVAADDTPSKKPYPVIIFSHGFGSTKDSFTALSKFWATYGYVVIHPTHADSGELRQILHGPHYAATAGPTTNAAEQVDELEADPKNWADRMADISLAIDSFPVFEAQFPDLKGKLDKKHIGVSGDAYGAFTAMLMGGIRVEMPAATQPATRPARPATRPASTRPATTRPASPMKAFVDKRVTAILAVSPPGPGEDGVTAESWGFMDIPMMVVSGSLDRVAAGQDNRWRIAAYTDSLPGSKYLLFIQKANHYSFGGAPAGPLTDYVRTSTIAFWDSALKADNDAQTFLGSNMLQAFSKKAATITAK